MKVGGDQERMMQNLERRMTRRWGSWRVMNSVVERLVGEKEIVPIIMTIIMHGKGKRRKRRNELRKEEKVLLVIENVPTIIIVIIITNVHEGIIPTTTTRRNPAIHQVVEEGSHH